MSDHDETHDYVDVTCHHSIGNLLFFKFVRSKYVIPP